MNDGIAVPFFGRDAMTAPALARLALRYDCPVIPTRLERIGGCRFRLTFHAPLVVETSGDRRRDVASIMTEVNRRIEGWIRDRPGQWLWLHRRWPEG
jgi:KDO2-lipid IV(A) lauroyltransferase